MAFFLQKRLVVRNDMGRNGWRVKNLRTDLGRNITNSYKTVTFGRSRVYAVFDFANLLHFQACFRVFAKVEKSKLGISASVQLS